MVSCSMLESEVLLFKIKQKKERNYSKAIIKKITREEYFYSKG